MWSFTVALSAKDCLYKYSMKTGKFSEEVDFGAEKSLTTRNIDKKIIVIHEHESYGQKYGMLSRASAG